MKVMCLRDNWIDVKTGLPTVGPKVGDPDTVIDSFKDAGRHWLQLERFPDSCYESKYFAILPEATADEMAEAEHEAIIM